MNKQSPHNPLDLDIASNPDYTHFHYQECFLWGVCLGFIIGSIGIYLLSLGGIL